ncbi:TRAP transporter large permease subunit [uncultured Alsobacter sp.]|uniref:TRAP transporter large permease subunit n=1 Tax=uncultured Alsobacter sp. TaxID=1748258 RepID=UPI0025EB3DF8|nr:TRAP transporter large permease subunit [uncultured Alsobacter sp.]
MALFGLGLLLLAALGLVLTGLPAFLVVFAAAVVGALGGLLTGQIAPSILAALPSRVVNLLESDLLQALPLYVLMGALMNRLPVGSALFRTAVGLMPKSGAAPAVAGIGFGALLGPMNGSVGASVMALSRSVVPLLEERGLPPAFISALLVVSSTLGVVIPPSLVLILLGDAMMAAHTIASNAMGRSERIMNTQDLFRGALVPAAIFVLASLAIAWGAASRIKVSAPRSDVITLSGGEIVLSLATVLAVAGLLGGVATGLFYAVEAAAAGVVVLFMAAALGGRLRGGAMVGLLDEVIGGTGALFALLVAATTLTLVLKVLGSDKLVADAVRSLPGGALAVTAGVLALVGASALILDAFEIVFVVVPIVAPPLLERATDAVWVGVLFLLILQTSFMAPPFGYALMLAQGVRRTAALPVWRAIMPYLAAQLAIVILVLTVPSLVHLMDPPAGGGLSPVLTDGEARKALETLPLPADDDAPPLIAPKP